MYALIWAVADDHLHENGIIGACGERPMDRIRREVEKTWPVQAGKFYDLGRSSIQSNCMWEGWV